MKFLLSFVFIFFANFVYADGFYYRIATEEFPPISFYNNISLKADGIGPNIVDEILKKLNIKRKIRVLPWARAYRLTIYKNNRILFCVARIPEREKLFQWAGPLFFSKVSFYTKANSKIIINSLEDAKKIKKIGVCKNFFDEIHLTTKGFKNLEPVTQQQQNIRKLMANRFEVITGTDITMPIMLKREGLSMKDVKKHFSFMNYGNYIVFSKKFPVEIVNQWRQQIDELKKDGTINDILKKWENYGSK